MQTNLEIALEEKIAFLRRREAFPDAPDTIEVIETHFAWVFLSRRYVYKLKKPIRFQELDLRTLQARRANCELELALNRRLAENVYIAVVPLTRNRERLEIGGAGETVDWLVQMHRLPRERMLDYAAAHASVGDIEIAALADKLCAFYGRAARASWDGTEYRSALTARIERYAAQFAELELPFDGDSVHALAELQAAFVRKHRALFEARIAAGRVVDAHGDLRPEHIFLAENPQIIDCLEFSAALRLLDTAEELAFLALECERLGYAAIGRRIFQTYEQRCADAVPVELAAFYTSVRALVRALLSAWHLGDDLDDAARALWDAQARWYLDAAFVAIRAANEAAERQA